MENNKEIRLNQWEQEAEIAKLQYQIQQVNLTIIEQVYQNHRRKDYQVMRMDEEGFLNFFPISLFLYLKIGNKH